MQKDKISIIVPVYKVEEWLKECVDSIRNQTYTNFELLLIDDESPDNCPAICDEYALLDKRIKVIHKENGGVSSARNVGIEVANGKYITFIDSDDYVDKNYLQKLYDNLKGCKISECGTIFFDEAGTKSYKKKSPRILEWESYLTETNLNGFLSYAVVYSKLYDASLFENIRFPVGRTNEEDESTSYKLIYNGKKISRIYDGLYYYRQRETGASQNKVTEKRITDCNAHFDEKISFFKDKGRADLVAFFSARKAVAFVYLYKNIEVEAQRDICYKIILDMFKASWNKTNVPIKYKLFTAFFIICVLVYRRG